MSLREAINAKCRDCIYDHHSGLGNWRQQVSACHIESCPLWAVRPKSKPRRHVDLAHEQANADE